MVICTYINWDWCFPGSANQGLFCVRFPSHEEGTVWAGPVLLCTLIPDFTPQISPVLCRSVPRLFQTAGFLAGELPLSEERRQLAQKSSSLFPGRFLVVS